jgi:hypothetical protein
MSWVSEFTGGLKRAIKDPITVIVAATYAFTGNWAMAATTIALSSASYAMALRNQPDIPDYSDFATEGANRTQMIKQPTVPRRFVYGETRVSGVLGYVQSTDDNKFLHMVILLAAHELDSYQKIFCNDLELTLDGDGLCTAPDQYAGLIRVETALGTDAQAANANLISESGGDWTSDHKLSGIAYMYVRLEYDRDAFPSGLPNFSALVRGKKLYDPRTATTAFSANPALAIRDYLTNTKYGFAADATEINDTVFNAAANACDEDVALDATVSGGGTENRYEIHGTFTTENAPKRILEEMITSCGGLLSYSNGKFSIKVAEYSTPTITLDENDLVSPITLQTKQSKRDNYNAIKGIFAPPETNYVITDYPALTSSTFETEDGGTRRFLDYDMPYTTSSPMAQRLAKIALYRNRQQIMLQGNFGMKAFDLQVGDNVYVTNSRLGFSSKVFEVAEWSLVTSADDDGNPSLSVALSLRETNSAVYDWDADEKAFQQDNTTLPDPFSLTLPTVLTDEGVVTVNQQPVATIEVSASSTNPQVIQFYAEYKQSTDTDYITLGYSDSGFFTIPNVITDVIYDIRVRSYGANARSPFVDVQHTVTGKTAFPSDVTNFSVNIVGENAQLSWTPVTDADLSHYVIRHTPDTVTPSYPNTTIIAEKVARPANTVTVPAVTGTYFIKAVDKFGNRSVNAAQQGARVDNIGQYNVVETSTQHTAFAGTKTNCAVTDDQLVLNTDANFDSATGLFDDATGFFDGGGTGIDQQQSGTYEFDSVIDLSAVYTSRVTSRVITSRIDFEDLFDTATGNFDDRAGLFDGDPLTLGDTNVELQVSTTDGDPAGTPTWSSYQRFVSGTYKARAFRFKAILTTTNPASTPAVSELSVTVDMPDLVSADNDIASGTGAKVITFVPPFKVLKGVGIAAGNLQSGDYYAITSKSATGFTITFYDNTDTAVDRTFDYVARGY